MKLYEVLAAQYNKIFPSSREKADFAEKFLERGEFQRILDIGCASGEFAFQLSSSQREITGIDLDPFMIAEAESQISSVSGSTIQFKQADMLRFLSESESDRYDLISCLGNTVVYLAGQSQLKDFLLSVKRALKPQGAMIVQILNYSNPEITPGFSFPSVETEDVEFKREYVPLDDSSKLGFKTSVKDKITGETETDLHRHFPFLSSGINEMAKNLGFAKTYIYGGYDRKEPEVSDFFHLIVLVK